MTTAYGIKEAAARSGFSAATLRYYETIGLVPVPDRTAAGYRRYDDRTLERLTFITRAKQLGCTLDEIAALTRVWDGGECGPVQDRLRALVNEKVTEAERRINELNELVGELRAAGASLAGHRPEGPCDDDCGCLGPSQPVALGAKPNRAEASVPIACSLSASAARERVEEWRTLLHAIALRESIDDGVRLTFERSVPVAELARLVAAEQECCGFFRFAITIDARGVALEVRAPADGLPVLAEVFGGVS